MKTKNQKISISLIISLIMMCIMCVNVNAAASYNVELSTGANNIAPGEQFEVTIKVKNITEIANGVAGISAKLTYDTTKLEKVGDTQGLNGFMVVEGDTIEIAKYPGVKADTDVAKITFKAKSNSSGSATITLSNVEAVDGTNKYPLTRNVEKSITIKSDSDDNGQGTEEKSNNSYLRGLAVDGTTVENFDKETLGYELVKVKNDKKEINITAVAEDTRATVTGTGRKALEVGRNTFKVTVTAENGSTRDYVINIEREAASQGESQNPSGSNNGSGSSSNGSNSGDKKDDTQIKKSLPQTGTSSLIIKIVAGTGTIAVISFIKIKKLKV